MLKEIEMTRMGKQLSAEGLRKAWIKFYVEPTSPEITPTPYNEELQRLADMRARIQELKDEPMIVDNRAGRSEHG